MKNIVKRKMWLLSLISTLGLAALAGCSGSGNSKGGASSSGGVESSEPFKVSMMLANYTTNPASAESSVWKKVEKLTNTKISIMWVPDAQYDDKLNITLSSGNIPMVIKTDKVKLPGIVNAMKAGAFWELGPYLKDYPNLSKANKTVLNNVSIDGKLYSIYRGRPLGRMGISFRKDWLDNLGMQPPKTIDEFYNMLKAFTNNDPDKNGQNDTFGMAVTKYAGPWDIMQVWFGVPNQWAEKDGKLLPSHMFPEYMDALKFFKKLNDEKLINADFAVYDPAKWNDMVLNGKAGAVVDVADRSQQNEDLFPKFNPNAKMDVIGTVSGPKGLRNLPTTGYAGVLLISKSSVKTEAELKKVLTYLDKLNDKELQVLLSYGEEGVHYKVEDSKLVILLTQNDMKTDNNSNDMSQLNMFIPEDLTKTAFKPATPLRQKVLDLYKQNESIIVPNPAEPIISATYTQKGAQLDNIIADARIKFIVGKLDENGFKDAVELWRKSGGDEYMKEINDAYATIKK